MSNSRKTVNGSTFMLPTGNGFVEVHANDDYKVLWSSDWTAMDRLVELGHLRSVHLGPEGFGGVNYFVNWCSGPDCAVSGRHYHRDTLDGEEVVRP